MIIVLTQLTTKQKEEILNDIKKKIKDDSKIEFYKLSEVCALSSKYNYYTAEIEEMEELHANEMEYLSNTNSI